MASISLFLSIASVSFASLDSYGNGVINDSDVTDRNRLTSVLIRSGDFLRAQAVKCVLDSSSVRSPKEASMPTFATVKTG
jgi:hypothetical protein